MKKKMSQTVLSIGDYVRRDYEDGVVVEGYVAGFKPDIVILQPCTVIALSPIPRLRDFSKSTYEMGLTNDTGTVEIINKSNKSNKPNITPMNALEFFRNLTATADEKLLKEFGLEDPIGTPTEQGLKLSSEITYKANRQAIIEIAQKMKAEQDAQKK